MLEGMKIKFTVIKNEDIKKHLDEHDRSVLSGLLWKVDQARFLEGKDINSYLVANIDEPYAPEIIEIFQRHGHWGITADPNQVEAVLDDGVLQIPAYHMGD